MTRQRSNSPSQLEIPVSGLAGPFPLPNCIVYKPDRRDAFNGWSRCLRAPKSRARVAILSRISLGGDLRRVDSGVVERQLQVQLLIVKLLHQILKYKLKHNFKYKKKYWKIMTQLQLQLVDQSFLDTDSNTVV